MLGYRCKRDSTQEPYWATNNIWPDFIRRDEFDHHYLVDVFKIICGEPLNRELILNNMLEFKTGQLIFNNNFDCDDADREVFAKIAATRDKCINNEKFGVITYAYPALVELNEESECTQYDELSHYTILVVSPLDGTVYSIDSRGLSYAVSSNPKWFKCLTKLKSLFVEFKWVDLIDTDIQAETYGDHFCQTWSLIIAADLLSVLKREILSTSRNRSLSRIQFMAVCAESIEAANYMTRGLQPIIDFWSEIVRIPEIKECLYYEIYSRTHSLSGARVYDRYFSTLEELVVSNSLTKNEVARDVRMDSDSESTDKDSSSSGGSGRGARGGQVQQYYRANVNYRDTVYTFIEDFVAELDDRLLQHILR